jgi:hypothetical protein
MLGIQARSRAAQRWPDCRHTLCREAIDRASGAAASPSISPAPAWWTANGCAASCGERKRASTCGPPAEYHLHKVFPRPGISSGRRLRHYPALA